MGRRELVLILAFVVLGAAIYRLTAPSIGSSATGFSVSRFVNQVRQEVAGDRARAERRLSARHPAGSDVRELRVPDLRGTLRIVGAARSDIAAEARVDVAGLDEADAARQAAQIELVLERSGDAVVAAIRDPSRSRWVRVDLVLEVPERLAVRLETVGRADVTGVAEVVLNTRGDTTVQRIAGAVRGEQRGGDLRIADAARLDLVTRLCDVTLERIAEEARLETTGGRLEVRASAARVRIQARRTDVRVERADQPLVIDHTEGDVDVGEARAAVRISGRRTDARVTLAEPVPVDVRVEDGATTIVLPADGGVHIDAVVRGGDIELEGFDLPLLDADSEQRVSGLLGGGGPAVVVRMDRGGLILRRSTSAGSALSPRSPELD